jgi:hypothetical protein
MKKMSAEDFLREKGWDDKNSVLGGVVFKGFAELLEEYAKLQPYDPNVPRFPSGNEINQMVDKYTNLEGTGNIRGEIYVFAGIEMIKTWLKEHGLL